MVRPPCCDKQNVKRGLWTAEEDAKILAYVAKYGTGNWTAVPKKAGLQRCGKSCRLRWSNYLRPDLNHDNFTPEEDDLIIRLHSAIGSRWSIIAQQLPGRTDNDVKNYWNTRLKKKLNGMGIDPVTHKPFSQIYADFGTIGGLLKSGSRIGSLSRDLKNVFNPKPEEEGVLGLSCTHFMTTPELLPKVEPTQEYCFLNNNTSNDSNDHSSFDLLDQLQAIKLLTEASNCTRYETNYNVSPHFLNQCAFLSTPSSSSSSSSSSSPSSSTCSTTAEEKPPITFSWRDFLLDDDLLPTDHHPQEQETAVQFSSKNFMRSQDQSLTAVQGQITNCEISMQNHGVPSNGSDQVPYSSSSSFLEAILDRENNGFLDFPSLFEEPFYF